MWALILVLYVHNVDLGEVGLMRNFTTEAACEVAAELAQKKVKKGYRLTTMCVPTRK